MTNDWLMAIAHILTPTGYNRKIRWNQKTNPGHTYILKIKAFKVDYVGLNLLEKSNSSPR